MFQKLFVALAIAALVASSADILIPPCPDFDPKYELYAEHPSDATCAQPDLHTPLQHPCVEPYTDGNYYPNGIDAKYFVNWTDIEWKGYTYGNGFYYIQECDPKFYPPDAKVWKVVVKCCACPTGYLSRTAAIRDDTVHNAGCIRCSGANEILRSNVSMASTEGYDEYGMKCEKLDTKCGSARCPTGNCNTNNETVNFLLDKEKFRPNFYDAGEGHKTIGYGHDCTANKDCDKFHPPISKPDARKLFEKDLASFERDVKSMPNSNLLNINQFSALVSFTFNAGKGGLKRNFQRYLETKNFDGLADAFPLAAVRPDNKNVTRGLRLRRIAEKKRFNAPTNIMSGC